MSDGGPDHRLALWFCTGSSTCTVHLFELRCSHSCVCLPLPNWSNTAESMMSFSNLAIQNVSLEGKEWVRRNGKVRSAIMSRECFKPRCVYSKTTLKREENKNSPNLKIITPVEAFCFLPASPYHSSIITRVNLNTIVLLWWSFCPFARTAEHLKMHWSRMKSYVISSSRSRLLDLYFLCRSDGQPHTWGATSNTSKKRKT